MIVVVIVLAVAVVVAIVLSLVTRSRLVAQRKLTESANASLATTTEERDAATAQRDAASDERDAATTRATDAEAVRDAAIADAERARVDTERIRAEAEALRAARSGVDADLLWALEQGRSERTWRQSVATRPDAPSVLQGAEHPLQEALQVELDAAREDVGAIVELDAELPPAVTAAGSVLVLRAAQELLARAVKVAEETTLVLRTEGDDVLVTVVATDDEDQPVAIEPLAIPESADMSPAEGGGVRIHGAAAP